MANKVLSTAILRVIEAKGRMSLKELEKNSQNPMEVNNALLTKILKDNADTEFGKAHKFSEIKTIEDFRRNIPVSGYDDYVEYIERMKNGETDLITSSKVLGYSRTSGSSGVPKYIPATEASIKAYTKYTWTRALALGIAEAKKAGRKYTPGKGLFLSPATNETLPDGTPCSNIAEIGARKFGFIYPYILTVPTGNLFDVNDGDYIYNIYRWGLMDENVSFIFSVFFSINVSQMAYLEKNWKVIVDDIEKGTIDESVKISPELRAKLTPMLSPMPERAAYLRKQFEQGFDETIYRRLWPNLTVICSIGNASFKPAADYIRAYAKGVPFDFSIYGASEGLVASCYETENTDMQLLVDSCFYEFIPYGEPDSAAVTIDKLEKGRQYEILITTQAGLYRYRLKDVLEVKGFRGKCPLISFVYRKGQMFNIAGEKFSEEDARNSVEALAKKYNIRLDNWAFYQDDSVVPSRYALLLENDTDINFEDHIDEIEEILGVYCKRYTAQREKKFISPLTVKRQKIGSHTEWAERCIARGASRAQVKPVHSLDNEDKMNFFLSRLEDN